uniref:Uncharacterized protein n=1 Tax=Arundo donax TaxID=35708 RepID=A0A0A9B9Z6_ARUDO
MRRGSRRGKPQAAVGSGPPAAKSPLCLSREISIKPFQNLSRLTSNSVALQSH